MKLEDKDDLIHSKIEWILWGRRAKLQNSPRRQSDNNRMKSYPNVLCRIAVYADSTYGSNARDQFHEKINENWHIWTQCENFTGQIFCMLSSPAAFGISINIRATGDARNLPDLQLVGWLHFNGSSFLEFRRPNFLCHCARAYDFNSGSVRHTSIRNILHIRSIASHH